MTNDKSHFHLLQLCVGTIVRNLETGPGPDALLELRGNLVDSEKGDHALRARENPASEFVRSQAHASVCANACWSTHARRQLAAFACAQ